MYKLLMRKCYVSVALLLHKLGLKEVKRVNTGVYSKLYIYLSAFDYP